MRRSKSWCSGIAFIVGLSVAGSVYGNPPAPIDGGTPDFGASALHRSSYDFAQDSSGGGESAEATSEGVADRPWTLDLIYSLYSDYIFRGINFSEYPREGRERANHQLSVDFGVDLASLLGGDSGSMGSLTFSTWFEWYAAQAKINTDGGGQNLQEVDYTIGWSYDVESIASTVGVAFVFYTFPNANAAHTQELDFSIEHNDAWMWKSLWPENTDGVLNPTLLYAIDLDEARNGSWIEFGISHGFSLTDNLALTPSWTLAIDHGYLDPILGTGRTRTTRLAYMQYGLNLDYDLTAGLELPSNLGALTLSGFLFFNDALGNPEDNGIIQDEFFGGVSLGWSF